MGVLFLGVLLLPATARAQTNAAPLALGDCLPRPTLPLPTCVPAVTVEEHALVTLMRARAWLRGQQFAEAAQALVKSLSQLAGTADVGLLVQSHAAFGQALLGLSRLPAAEKALQGASGLWASEAALTWIRSLPSSEDGQRSLELAADAASEAVLRLAESHLRSAEVALPRFTQGAALEPFAPRQDSQLRPTELAARQAWAKRQRAAFIRYLQEQVAPWLESRHQAIAEAEQELERVYLVPVLAPQARVAVAANVGSLWARLVEGYRTASDSCGSACKEFHNAYYGTFDSPDEPYKQLARSAFEVGIALSRQHQFVTEYTLICERWLARNYRGQYASFDELVPSADWLPSSPKANDLVRTAARPLPVPGRGLNNPKVSSRSSSLCPQRTKVSSRSN